MTSRNWALSAASSAVAFAPCFKFFKLACASAAARALAAAFASDAACASAAARGLATAFASDAACALPPSPAAPFKLGLGTASCF